MNKICKRFLALVVIATMTFSSNSMCFAAGLDESSGTYVDVIDCDVCGDFNPNGGVVDVVVNTDGTVSIVN